jgi:hypothetical protein
MIKFIYIKFLTLILIIGCSHNVKKNPFLEKSQQELSERIDKGSLAIVDSLQLLDQYGLLDVAGLNINEFALFIGDYSNSTISVIDKETFELIRRVEIQEGRGPGELLRIGAFDVNSNYLVVGNENERKIQFWNMKGEFVSEFISEEFSPHRININSNNHAIILSTISATHLFNEINSSGEYVSGFGQINSSEYNPLMFSGSTVTDDKDNYYYAGFSEHILKKWDADGNLQFSVSSIDNFPGEINYATFSGNDEQRVYRYSEHGYFSAIGSTIYKDYWLILHGGVSGDEDQIPLLDIYSTNNGKYLNSFSIPYRAGRGQIAANDNYIFMLHDINDETYLVVYRNPL